MKELVEKLRTLGEQYFEEANDADCDDAQATYVVAKFCHDLAALIDPPPQKKARKKGKTR
jgi:hypothetical protein